MKDKSLTPKDLIQSTRNAHELAQAMIGEAKRVANENQLPENVMISMTSFMLLKLDADLELRLPQMPEPRTFTLWEVHQAAMIVAGEAAISTIPTAKKGRK